MTGGDGAPSRFDLVASLFREAVALDESSRQGFLAMRCGADDELRREVEGLIAAEALAPAALDDAALASGAQRRFDAALDDAPPAPQRIGHYEIGPCIGRGGMGAVYRATQERPRREVALKIIHPAAMSPALRRRFALEAEILGRLEHPGIARIYEAGVDDADGVERPYLAMELIDGAPLDVAARDRGLDARTRIGLVADVCDAVQHAHQRGIIHRDLKPSNVLVDGAGHARVLDFGVARAIGTETVASTLATSPGQLVGTLPYMSPEQIAGDPRDVDVRSDVYALGITLYELLVGRRPVDLADRSIYEAIRIARETRVPRPSSADARWRGDVDTIVARATDPDPGRRYQSAAELGRDLRLHLEGRPITARRDAPGYVLWRTLVRHRAAVAVAAVVLALVGLLVGVQIYNAGREAVTRDTMALLSVDETVNDPFSDDVRPLDQLERAAEWAEDELASQPIEAAALHSLIGIGLLRHGRYADADEHLERALDLRLANLDDPDDPRIAEARHNHGRARYFLGDYEGAEARYRAALAHRRRLLEASSSPNERGALNADERRAIEVGLADSLNDLGMCLRRQGRYDEAEAQLVEALERRERLGLERWVAASLNNLAVCYKDQERWADAEARFRAALAKLEQFEHVNATFLARGMRSIAECRLELGAFDEAAGLIARARATIAPSTGTHHPDMIRCGYLDARLALARGAAPDAERLARAVLEQYASIGDQPRAHVADALVVLGRALLAQGRPGEARAPLERAVTLRRASRGPDDPSVRELESLLPPE